MTLDKVYIDNMNNIILSVIHPSTHLRFDAEDSKNVSAICDRPYQVFTVEAAELTNGRTRPLWGRIFNDASDVGFWLKSERTDKCEAFYLSDEKYSRDGDVDRWTFKPVNQALRMEIVVFND